MDCIEELLITTEVVKSLHLLPLQHFIDEDVAECVVYDDTPHYFGMKWTKTNCVWSVEPKGLNAHGYVRGVKVATDLCLDSITPYQRSINGLICTFNSGNILSYIQCGDFGIYTNAHILSRSISVYGKFTYENFTVRILNIDSSGIKLFECDAGFVKNGIKYDAPYFITTVDSNEKLADDVVKTDESLNRVDESTIWSYDDDGFTITYAGYLVRRGEPTPNLVPININKGKMYPAAPFTPPIILDKAEIEKILEIMPPVTLENILYTPQIYMNCVSTIVSPFNQPLKAD